jgi:hypothetical protein
VQKRSRDDILIFYDTFCLFSFVLSLTPTNSRKVRFSLKYIRSFWSMDDMRLPSVAHPPSHFSVLTCLLSPVLLLSNQFTRSFTCSHSLLLADPYLFIPTLSLIYLGFSTAVTMSIVVFRVFISCNSERFLSCPLFDLKDKCSVFLLKVGLFSNCRQLYSPCFSHSLTHS